MNLLSTQQKSKKEYEEEYFFYYVGRAVVDSPTASSNGIGSSRSCAVYCGVDSVTSIIFWARQLEDSVMIYVKCISFVSPLRALTNFCCFYARKYIY